MKTLIILSMLTLPAIAFADFNDPDNGFDLECLEFYDAECPVVKYVEGETHCCLFTGMFSMECKSPSAESGL